MDFDDYHFDPVPDEAVAADEVEELRTELTEAERIRDLALEVARANAKRCQGQCRPRRLATVATCGSRFCEACVASLSLAPDDAPKDLETAGAIRELVEKGLLR